MDSNLKHLFYVGLSGIFCTLLLVCNAGIVRAEAFSLQSDTLGTSVFSMLEKEAAGYMKRYKYKDAIGKLKECMELEARAVAEGRTTPGKEAAGKVRMALVQCYKKLNLFNEAIGILGGLYRADTTDVQIMGELADCWLLAADYAKCAGMYTKMLEQDSTNTYFELQRALVNIKGEYWNDALAGLNNLYRRGDSTNNIIVRLLGDCYYNTGNGDMSLKLYDKAIQLKPTDQLAVRKISLINLNIDRAALAVKYTGDYMALDSSNVEVNRLNGIARYVTRDFDGAIEVLGKLLAQGDDTYASNYYYGLSKAATFHYYEAIPPLTVAYQYDTTNIDVVFHLGNAYCSARSSEKRGIELLTQGLAEMQPKQADLLKYNAALANGYAGMGKYLQAIKCMETAYATDPQYTEALYYIAVYYEALKTEKEKAAGYYRDYLKVAKNRNLSVLAQRRYKQLQEDLFMEGIEIEPLEIPAAGSRTAKDTTGAKVP